MDGDGTALWGWSIRPCMAVRERRRVHPGQKGGLVSPPSDDEPLPAVVGRSQKLETLEALLVVYRTCSRSESSRELVSGVVGDRDRVDLDERHGSYMSRRSRTDVVARSIPARFNIFWVGCTQPMPDQILWKSR